MNGPDGKWIGYGVGDISPEVSKLERRLCVAYPRSSKAIELGVTQDDVFDLATQQAVKNLAAYINNDSKLLATMAKGKRLDRAEDLGVADLAFRKAVGAYVPVDAAVPPVYRSKYPIQGVWADSRAFLMPPEAHSFNKATDAFCNEALNLYRPMAGTPIVVSGYSMGGVSVAKFLRRLPVEWRPFVKAVVTFGDPSMPAGGSLLGNDPGEGISKLPQPDWCLDRYWSFSIDGDWYPRARGHMFLLYEILTHAELTLEFAMYLLKVLPTLPGRILTGQEPSDDPLSGVLGPLAKLISSGGANTIGTLFAPLQLLAALPQVIWLLTDAIKFVATGAHGMYYDQRYRLWDGVTAVEKAEQIVRQNVPDGATQFLFPGTWSNWNQLFQYDLAIRLY